MRTNQTHPHQLVTVATVAACMLLAVPRVWASSILVFGDRVVERDQLTTDLTGLGHTVTNVSTLPADLSPYRTVWHVGQATALTAAEQSRLIAFVNSGHGLHLTGERPCCETLNASLGALLNAIVTAGGITVGGQGDVTGPYPFNASAADGVADTPNLLTQWNPSSPGGVAGLGSLPDANILATGTGNMPVGGAWDATDLTNGRGRITLLMDVNWFLTTGHASVAENIETFLDAASCTTAQECDDGDACNGAEICDALQGCQAGTPPVCDDGNVCNGAETCDAVNGCQAGTPLTCDDGNVCNGAEICDAGQGCMAGTPLVCSDGNVCNGAETCDAVNGCQAGTPLTCDDGNVCNGAETCDAGQGCLAGTPLVCDDGDVCNGAETCDAVNGCQAGTPLTCDDGNVCNGLETCDAQLGCQAGTPLSCSDGVACTDDTCDPQQGCLPSVPNNANCNDSNVCNGAEICDAGQGCLAGTPLTCNDGVACTDDTCDPIQGCQSSANDANCADADLCNGAETCDAQLGCQSGTPLTCNDDNVCNGTETCDAQLGCQAGTPLSCSDGVACTDDTCDPQQGCLPSVPNNANCNDSNVCNGTETCDAQLGCQAGTPLSCSDGVTCTDDTCDPQLGCQFSPNNSNCADADLCNGTETCDAQLGCQSGTPLTCDDGNVCNGAETCDAQLGCQSGTPLTCSDGVTCTDDTCDAQLGCQFTPNNANCADADLCNGTETCDAQLGCQSGTPLTCSDGVTCTDDTCDPQLGCQFTPNNANCADADLCNGTETCDAVNDCQAGTPLTCDDGNVCNGAETCDVQLGCQAGTPLSCSDGVTCTDDTCDAQLGCQFTPNNANCADADLCNGTETCDAQLGCQSGTPLTCDDGNVCNGAETCDAQQGCLAGTPLTCNDGVACTDDTCDPIQGCQSSANDANCTDADLCNGAETCDAVNDCQAGTPLTCSDSVTCTDDTCDPLQGCQFTPNNANCTDNNVCNGTETCDAVNDCQAGTSLACDDGNVCNGAETCDAQLGCQSGTPLSCPNDGVACTDDCDPQSGCVANVPNNANCDDGVACTTDTCDPILDCQYTPNDPVCDDGVACTIDSCNVVSDCQHMRNHAQCNDGEDCTIDFCDSVAGCQNEIDPTIAYDREEPGCGNCSDGIDNDTDNQTDTEDSACSTLGPIEPFALLAGAASRGIVLGREAEVVSVFGNTRGSTLPFPVGKSGGSICAQEVRLSRSATLDTAAILADSVVRRGVVVKEQLLTAGISPIVRKGNPVPLVGEATLCTGSNPGLVTTSECQALCTASDPLVVVGSECTPKTEAVDCPTGELCDQHIGCPTGELCDQRRTLADASNSFVSIEPTITSHTLALCRDALPTLADIQASLRALPVDQTESEVWLKHKAQKTIAVSTGAQVVISIPSIRVGQKSKLTFQGTIDQTVVVVVSDLFRIGRDAEVALDGLDPTRVLFFADGPGDVSVHKASKFAGTIFAPERFVTLGREAELRGSAIGNMVRAKKNSLVYHEPFVPLVQ